jgi:hypothetical protein
MWPRRFPVRVRVQRGRPIAPGGAPVSTAVAAEARRLLAEVAR